MHRICWIKLYKDKSFKGTYSHWKSKGVNGPDWRVDSMLSNNKVGNNQASSQRSHCDT